MVRDTVDSTMAEAARLAPTIDRPTWILAKRQTAARRAASVIVLSTLSSTTRA